MYQSSCPGRNPGFFYCHNPPSKSEQQWDDFLSSDGARRSERTNHIPLASLKLGIRLTLYHWLYIWYISQQMFWCISLIYNSVAGWRSNNANTWGVLLKQLWGYFVDLGELERVFLPDLGSIMTIKWECKAGSLFKGFSQFCKILPMLHSHDHQSELQDSSRIWGQAYNLFLWGLHLNCCLHVGLTSVKEIIVVIFRQ